MHGGKDKPMWILTADRKFSVKTLYMFLLELDSGFLQEFMWKIKIPTKIKVFRWLIILTRNPEKGM